MAVVPAVILLSAAAVGAVGSRPGSPLDVGAPMTIAQACPGSTGTAEIDRRGGAAVGTCWGNAAQAPVHVGVSASSVWNWFGCDQWRPYSPGSVVSGVSRASDVPLLLEDVASWGLDPTVVYYWHTVECEHHSVGADGGELIEVWGWGLLVIGATEPVDPLVLRDRAASRIDPLPPTPLTSPPWDAVPSVVQMPTWLWLPEGEWVVAEESETSSFVTVVVQATPVDHTWRFGDGSVVVCPGGPGVAWDGGSGGTQCGHTFTEANPAGWSASVTVRWVFRWWLNGNDMGEFGEFERVSSFVVPVSEIQVVEVS